jgi:long-chain fatty acid transport protein
MKIFNKIICLSVSAALASWSASGVAGGFGIGTQSGSGTGNAFAGGAAVAEDASVVWSNPAGMTALPTGYQITGALHIVKPSFKFSNTGSTGAFLAPGTGEGGDGGDWAYIPNGFFAMSITPALRIGVALNAPFGLTTNFDAGWRGQLVALKSAIKTVNIQPSIAYQVSNAFSVGAGVSVQKIDAKLTNSAGPFGVATLTADDIGFGFNLGAVFQPSPATRVGLHYRSAIKYDLEGNINFDNATTNARNGVGAAASLKVPDSASFSILQKLGSQLEIMGDVTWTGWDKLQELKVVRTTSSAAPLALNNPLGGVAGSTFTILPFEWDNTWRFGLGANYRLNSQTKLRFGVAYDKTPTNDTHRSPRLPDQDRTWVALGVQYKPTKQGTLEVGYAHEFVKDATVNNTSALAPNSRLVGSFKVKADIFSVQYSHAF